MRLEPFFRQARDLVESARLFKEVAGAGNDSQLLRARELLEGLAVEVEHDVILAADDQERRRPDLAKGVSGQIGPAAAGDDGVHHLRMKRRGDQGRAASGAGAEEAQLERPGRRLALEPAGGGVKAASQKLDVEDLRAILRLRHGQEVNQ